MDALNYRLETFEGPLDLLLSLIQKNKMSIDNIQINVICEQYIQYIEEAQSLDMELASEFIVMASELMLIKSKLLLPKPEAEEEDPRAALADALLKYQQAKEAAKKMALLYPTYSARLEKDTDEISVDKTFVLDQEVESLCLAVRRIITYNENRPKIERSVFTPMISSPIVPVEVKITGILNKMSKKKATSLKELLDEHSIRKWLKSSLFGYSCTSTTFRLIWKIDVLKFPSLNTVLNLLLELICKRTGRRNILNNCSLSLLHIREHIRPMANLCDCHFIQATCTFFTISTDKRNSCPILKEVDTILHLPFLYLQAMGNTCNINLIHSELIV